MSIEKPPTKDIPLSTYLLRVLEQLENAINVCRTHVVTGDVKNPVKGRLYLVTTSMPQFGSQGLFYYNGTQFVKISDVSSAVSLGITHDKAYYGDFGEVAYQHSKILGNPHKTTAADIGLENVDNTSDLSKPISNAVSAALQGYVLKTTKINNKPLDGDITLNTSNINPVSARQYVTAEEKLRLNTPADASHDGYLLSTDWVIFNGKQNALGFTPENVANKVIAWSMPTDTQYPSAKLVNDTFALYLPLSSYHNYYKGLFGSLAALNTALPTGVAGEYAQVDTGLGSNPDTYFWDATDNAWVLNSSTGSGAVNTDGLPEGTTNLYFTEVRVRATLLTGFSAGAGTVGSTDSILTAFNKIVGNFNTPASYPTLNQNTTGSAAKLTTARTIDGISFDGTANITTIAEATHAATSKTTPVDADELPLADSEASNALKKLTWANLKAILKTYFDGLYLAAWTTWTPTWTGITIGNASVTGRYIKDKNNIVHATLDVIFGSTTSTSGAAQYVSLPVAAVSRISTSMMAQGVGFGAVFVSMQAWYDTTTRAALVFEISSGAGSASGFAICAIAWTNTYKLSLNFTYEAA